MAKTRVMELPTIVSLILMYKLGVSVQCTVIWEYALYINNEKNKKQPHHAETWDSLQFHPTRRYTSVSTF